MATRLLCYSSPVTLKINLGMKTWKSFFSLYAKNTEWKWRCDVAVLNCFQFMKKLKFYNKFPSCS